MKSHSRKNCENVRICQNGKNDLFGQRKKQKLLKVWKPYIDFLLKEEKKKRRNLWI